MTKLPIKALRATKNLTQKEVAEKLGINRNTYSSWENYKTFPSLPQLIRLSEVFECSLDTFYFPKSAS